MELIDIIRLCIELFSLTLLTLFFGSYSLYIFKNLKKPVKVSRQERTENEITINKENKKDSTTLKIPLKRNLDVLNKNDFHSNFWASMTLPKLIPVKSNYSHQNSYSTMEEMYKPKIIWK
jgi:hypothetical protein